MDEPAGCALTVSGDLDGVKGVYHITGVDASCQGQVEACVEGISVVLQAI